MGILLEKKLLEYLLIIQSTDLIMIDLACSVYRMTINRFLYIRELICPKKGLHFKMIY